MGLNAGWLPVGHAKVKAHKSIPFGESSPEVEIIYFISQGEFNLFLRIIQSHGMSSIKM